MLRTIETANLPERLQVEKLGILACRASELPDEYVQQLVDKSRQPHIMEFEGHEDVGTEENPGRFRDIESYRKWAAPKERVFYMMIDDALHPDGLEVPDIGGVIWFGHQGNRHAPGRELTFAIRNYTEDKSRGWGQYAGRGLGTPFMQATHQDLRSWYPAEKIWLEVVEGNEAACKLYEKNGYLEIDKVVDENYPERRRVVMVNDTALSVAGGEAA